MLDSTTDYLKDLSIHIHEKLSVKGLWSKPSLPLITTQNQKKEYAVRYACVQAIFLRCSFVEKIKLVTQFFKNINNIVSIKLILDTMISAKSKLYMYSLIHHCPNSPKERLFLDHSRSMDEETFQETMEEVVAYFKTIEDAEQISMIIALLRLGGTALRFQASKFIVKIYHCRLLQAKKPSEDQQLKVLTIKSPQEYDSVMNLEMGPDKEGAKSPRRRTLSFQIDVDHVQVKEEEEPSCSELARKKKHLQAKWDDLIAGYRLEIATRPDQKEKEGKKGKRTKKNAKKTTTKKEKGGDQKKSKETDFFDSVQLMPFWIALKIFNYCDPFTLMLAREVNMYWTFAVDALLKERVARKKMKKICRKLEKRVDRSLVLPVPEETLESRPRLNNQEKRIKRLDFRGATLPNLVPPLTRPYRTTTLITDTLKYGPKELILPYHRMEAFPRSFRPEESLLYKKPTVVINEVGFIPVKETPLDYYEFGRLNPEEDYKFESNTISSEVVIATMGEDNNS